MGGGRRQAAYTRHRRAARVTPHPLSTTSPSPDDTSVLLVPTRLRPSPRHGLGVFAAAPIEAGTVVWRFEPGLDLEFTPDRVAGLPAHVRRWFDHFGYRDRRTGLWVLCFDDARFMNHADDPNTRPDFGIDPPRGVDVAATQIAEGEEITSDYATFELQPRGFVDATTKEDSPAGGGCPGE